MNFALSESFQFGWISTQVYVCLGVIVLFWFIAFKPVVLATIVGCTIALLYFCWKTYPALTDAEFYSVLAWRYALAFILFYAGSLDYLSASHEEAVYDAWGVQIGTVSTPMFFGVLFLGLIQIGIAISVLDGLVPYLMHGIPWSSFKPFGIYAIALCVLADGRAILSLIKSIFGRRG